ncbi:hypothetical protein KIJ96_12565 [Pseudoalteromonas piscicida]|uniref:hypothetical protein n=1 Tax=Pseudoalteromonas piscicida TaxID=43662 RepID=UPI001D0B502C|nr:hypothetical protein [Pseudoalteromonas piscicida]UDM60649.1 hypothetical protein KIJ96_12565 [Pseudoalteromonas piscicida]
MMERVSRTYKVTATKDSSDGPWYSASVEEKGSAVRWLTLEERKELRRDMAESSAWAKAELKRRRAKK